MLVEERLGVEDVERVAVGQLHAGEGGFLGEDLVDVGCEKRVGCEEILAERSLDRRLELLLRRRGDTVCRVERLATRGTSRAGSRGVLERQASETHSFLNILGGCNAFLLISFWVPVRFWGSAERMKCKNRGVWMGYAGKVKVEFAPRSRSSGQPNVGGVKSVRATMEGRSWSSPTRGLS